MAEASTRRVELIAESSDSKREAARTGGGLMVGLFLGRNSLMAAATGAEQFEIAVAHFVGLVLASVAGALLIGAIYDRAIRSAERAANEAAKQAELDAEEPNPSPELPIGMPT
jgi:hypothetical protein